MEKRKIPADIEQPERVVTVLQISPHESDHASLRQIFSHSKWLMHAARSCAEAASVLKRKSISVVMCERELPDGSWKDVLELTSEVSVPPPLIVTCRLADDHLWSEVLNLGGYDVLRKPFNKTEVFRDVSLAWLHWKNECGRVHRERERPRLAGGAG